jgi:hypothetical protein
MSFFGLSCAAGFWVPSDVNSVPAGRLQVEKSAPKKITWPFPLATRAPAMPLASLAKTLTSARGSSAGPGPSGNRLSWTHCRSCGNLLALYAEANPQRGTAGPTPAVPTLARRIGQRLRTVQTSPRAGLMKLLVDECLSEELAKLAQRRGHAEASHIAWIGKCGWKDWVQRC